jgi:hypothetical protein
MAIDSVTPYRSVVINSWLRIWLIIHDYVLMSTTERYVLASVIIAREGKAGTVG